MQAYFYKRIFILFIICYAAFLYGNNLVSLTDPDEVFYSLTAKEMAAKNEWLTPFIFDHPQFEKPVLTFWLIEIAFKAWGENPFTARFFPALFGTLGVMAVYAIGLIGFKDERKAFFSALVLATSAFFVGMGKTVFTDMIFTVFILYALTLFMLGFTDRRWRGAGFIGFYLFSALATLTKGPLGWLLPQLIVILFLLYQRQINLLRNRWVAGGFLLFLALTLPWYSYMIGHYGQAFIQEFFTNDHWRRLLTAEHKGNDHWFFYPATMLAGFFPWSLFLAAAMVDMYRRLKNTVTSMDHLLLSWILVVFVVFQIAHSKLASYILPLFPALALMTGNYLGNCLSEGYQRKKIQNLIRACFIMLAFIGIVPVSAQHLLRHYISSQSPVYFLSGSLIAVAGIGMTLSLKEHIEPALYVLAMSLCPIFLTAFMIHSDLEGYVSSYEACEYVPQRSSGGMTVLTSKANARGIRYYTGQDVAVVDFGGKPFFSPHPIVTLDSKDKMAALLEHQPVTFGVVRKSVYQSLLKDFSNHFRIILLKNIGYDYVVRINKINT
ncbi:MAG: glycosyltransferase family 39 protein [Candidatus Omnitrophica bacterium]|nr:glycosyltransferase family 39 protein [Candidatus Omnitrophota bacterium]